MLRFKRGFAQVSAVSYTRKGEQPAFAPAAIKAISKTQAGVTVATQDKQGPASSVAVFIKAGSRFDSSLKPGVAHLAKRSVFRVRGFSRLKNFFL